MAVQTDRLTRDPSHEISVGSKHKQNGDKISVVQQLTVVTKKLKNLNLHE